MTVQLFNGLWLFIDGLLATDPACCCGGCCNVEPLNCHLLVTVTGGPSPGTYEWDFEAGAWVGPAAQGVVSYDIADCRVTYTEADTPYSGSCDSWSATASAYVSCSTCCPNNFGLGCVLVDEDFTTSQTTDCTGQMPTNITLALSCSGSTCCGGPCQWIPVWLYTGDWAGGWELLSGFCSQGCLCPEPDVTDVGTEANPAQAEPYATTCAEPAQGLSVKEGPGTELKKLLAAFGLKAGPQCKCNQMAARMNAWGPDESLRHTEQIVDAMQRAAKARKLPFLRAIGRRLVQIACKRARRKSGQSGQ